MTKPLLQFKITIECFIISVRDLFGYSAHSRASARSFDTGGLCRMLPAIHTLTVAHDDEDDAVELIVQLQGRFSSLEISIRVIRWMR